VARVDGVCDPQNVKGGPRSKPLPNYQKIVWNRIKACQLD